MPGSVILWKIHNIVGVKGMLQACEQNFPFCANIEVELVDKTLSGFSEQQAFGDLHC